MSIPRRIEVLGLGGAKALARAQEAATSAAAAVTTATSKATEAVAAALEAKGYRDQTSEIAGLPTEAAAQAYNLENDPDVKAVLSASIAGKRQTTVTPTNDRVAYAPADTLSFGWTFLPMANPGDHFGAAIIKNAADGKYRLHALYGHGNLGMIRTGEVLYSINGDSVFDPYMMTLPNGDWLMAFHSGDEGSIYVMKSTDKGATWAVVKEFHPGDPFVTNRRFSEAMIHRLPLGNISTGTSDRLVMTWADIDPVPEPKVRPDAQICTAFSDDGGETWSADAIVTPGAGDPASPNLLSDNTRPWVYTDRDGGTQLVYSRVEDDGTGTFVVSIWHCTLSQNGQARTSTPYKVTDCTVAASTRTDHEPGASPSVWIGRDGKYHMTWGESDYAAGGSDGALFIMHSTDGKPGNWTGKQQILARTDAPNGFGRTMPVRVDGRMELFYGYVNTATTNQARSVTLADL